jgi:putative hydrolase of the HAD superfamily
MAEIEVLFFDIGGVLLSNGWDGSSRRKASEHFGLDLEDLEDRHASVSNAFDTGNLTIGQYVRRTVMYRDRGFAEDEFVEFMKAESKPDFGSLDLVRRLADGGRYLLATLNNESRELNDHRIDKFGLRDHFSLFLSSCYLGVRKPDEAIFRMAIDIIQHRPEECVFIDNRELNLECANLIGMRTILFQGADKLRDSLAELGITI